MRGEWIEIGMGLEYIVKQLGLSPCGESGLKFTQALWNCFSLFCLSPCGESGLK